MSDTIGYGVIGSGMMGGEHILDLNHVDGAEVVALADPVSPASSGGSAVSSPDRAAPRPRSRVATYADHRDLLADPNVDVV
jgi:myo-inositol 2-dehydrogenase/D-chiro-inositol 1-dehydrogenase